MSSKLRAVEIVGNEKRTAFLVKCMVFVLFCLADLLYGLVAIYVWYHNWLKQ